MDCSRSITFVIPGTDGSPDVQVTAVEDNGAIEFTVEVITTSDGVTADLRGLFFNVTDNTKLLGLLPDGATVSDYDTEDVINLGQGANMHGAAEPFDVGVEFGGPGIGKNKLDVQTATFVLTNDAGDLTLDDIAQVEFGVRLTSVGVLDGERENSAKNTTIAPAAPDAVDDSYDIFEDGQSGLDDPSSTSDGVVFSVLDNDTDADGDTLTITEVYGMEHGTVQIIDGDDADDLPGDALLFTPDVDYAGPDEFVYCITDNNGGTDFATVTVAIEAVADIPDVSIESFATDNVNEIRLVVTATQTDDDESEFIQRLVSSALPPGVTLSPAGPAIVPGAQGTEFTQEYLLTVPLNTDTDFDLTFTATSEELSNGDTETGDATIDIVFEYNEIDDTLTFDATDQSIWGSGDAFEFVDDRFIGINTGNFNESTTFGPFNAGISGHIQAGFQSTLTFNGGEIDATSVYEVTVATSYNETVDELLIETSETLVNAFFDTIGPTGSYTLDFIWDILLEAYAGVSISFGELGSLNETINFPALDIGPGSFNILDLNSDLIGGSITLPPPVDSLTVNFAWPTITTSGSAPPLDPVTSSGASNDFLDLVLDIDDLITTLAGLPANPFNPRIDIGPFYAELDILNIFADFGLNFLQDFEMSMGDLQGMVTFEDGTSQLITIGGSIQISDASLIDLAGDGDGIIEFDFELAPAAELDNETSLGFNIGGGIEILSGEAGYDIFGFSGSEGFDPLVSVGFSEPIADVEVYADTFALAYEAETFSAFA